MDTETPRDKDVRRANAQEEVDRLLVMLRDSARAAADALHRHHRSGVQVPPMISFLIGSLVAAFSSGDDND